MVLAAIEARTHVETETNQAPFFMSAAEMGVLEQARLAHRTNGSFQPQWYTHNSIYYPYDGVSLNFHEEKGFSILERFVGKEQVDIETAHPDAMVAYDPEGSVHIVWAVASDNEFAFDSFTITPGINMKNVHKNGVSTIEPHSNSVIMQAAILVRDRVDKLQAA